MTTISNKKSEDKFLKKFELIEKTKQNIKDSMYFDTNKVPEKEWFYERQLYDEILDNIISFIMGSPGADKYTLIHGNNGSGKTHNIEYILKELGKRQEQIAKFESKIVNCKNIHNSYGLMKAILGVKKAQSEDYVKQNFIDYLDENELPFILFLDDMYEMDDDTVLYIVSRLGQLTGRSREIMLIMSSRKSYAQIFPNKIRTMDVDSSCPVKQFLFKDYELGQLETILKLRTSQGLVKYNDSLIRYLATGVIKIGDGDARLAIKSLGKITMHPDFNDWQEKTKKGNPEHANTEIQRKIHSLVKESLKENQTNYIRGLSDAAKLVLYVAIKYSLNKSVFDYDKRKNVQYALIYLNAKFGKYSMSITKFNDILDELSKSAIIDIDYVKKVSSVVKVVRNNLSSEMWLFLLNHLYDLEYISEEQQQEDKEIIV